MPLLTDFFIFRLKLWVLFRQSAVSTVSVTINTPMARYSLLCLRYSTFRDMSDWHIACSEKFNCILLLQLDELNF